MMKQITPKSRLLIIEDEPDLCEAMTTFLELEGFDVKGVESTTAADAWLEQHPVDIIILDVGLPDQDGLVWFKQIRDQHDRGLIVTTARGDLPDRLRGLNVGADAYLIKPVELEELELVVRNVAHRLGLASEQALGWVLHPIRWELLARNGTSVKLTCSETALLTTLAATPGHPVARDEMVRALGHTPENYDPRRMEILTRRLRNKVKEQCGIRLPLETVHGYGYAFVAGIDIEYTPD